MFSASRVSFCGALATFLISGGLLLTVDAAQPPPSPPPARASGHSAFVGRYCVSCHNDRLKRGGLTLDAAVATDIGASPEVWEKVLRKVRARQMPPIGLPRPDEATYNAEIATLETALDRVALSTRNPGRTATLRRLTRTEYQNAIRDLLALDVDVTSLLPADESSYGFDNVTVGDLSPTLLDRYIAAAEKISRVAVGRPSVSPDGDTIRIPADLTQEEHIEGLPIGTRGGALVDYTFPMDGDYEFQIRLTRDRNEHVEGLNDAADLELLLDRERVKLFTVKPPAREAGFARRRLHREQLDALAIEQQLQIGGVVEPLDVLVAIARQANLELVVAVHREGVVDERAAARADRQPFDVFFLREIDGSPDRVAIGRYARASHGDAADLLGRRDVAIEQRRREIADRHVVEAVARFVGGQERRDVHVERQQIVDGVLVLGARHAAQRRRPARIRRRGCGAIERGFERRDLRVVG